MISQKLVRNDVAVTKILKLPRKDGFVRLRVELWPRIRQLQPGLWLLRGSHNQRL